MKRILFLLLYLFLFHFMTMVNGQGLFQLGFQTIFGDTLVGASFSIQNLGDSGYVAGGYTGKLGTVDFQLSKIDGYGNFLWSRAYGGNSGEFCTSVDVSSDGGLIMTGWGKSFGAGDDDVFLLKTDDQGVLQWSKTFGGASIDRGRAVIQTNDGGYAIAGHTNSVGFGLNDILVIKTDMNGDTLWTRTYGVSGNDAAWSMVQTSDSGYIITGNTSSGPGFLNAFLLKITQSGDTAWARTYGAGSGLTSGRSVVEAPSGGYALTGWTSAFGAGNKDAFLLRTDPQGNIIWAKSYGGLELDDATGLTVINPSGDFGFGISGNTRSFGVGLPNSNILMIQTDSSGNTGGDVYVVGDSLDDTAFGICPGPFQGMVAIGNGYFIEGKPSNTAVLNSPNSVFCVSNSFPVQGVSFSFDLDTMILGIETGGYSLSSPTMFDSLIFQSDSVLCFHANFWGIEESPIIDASVFPNPSDGHIGLTYEPQQGPALVIEAFDVLGRSKDRSVKFLQPSLGELLVDLSGLDDGQYILKVVLEDRLLRARVLIRH